MEQRDLYDRRPSVLKSWSKGHVTMLGDAVHPVCEDSLQSLSNVNPTYDIHTDDA